MDQRDMLLMLRHPDGNASLVGWTLRQKSDGPAAVSFLQGRGDTQKAVLTHRPAILATAPILSQIAIEHP